MFKNIFSKIFNKSISVLKPNDEYVFILRKNKYDTKTLISYNVFYKNKRVDIIFFRLIKNGTNTIINYSDHWLNRFCTNKLPTNYPSSLRKDWSINNNSILNIFYEKGIII